MHRALIKFNFAGREIVGSADFAAIVCILLSICDTLISMQFPSFMNSQRARARHVHMQIIAVGVTNRRDQQEARFIAFVVPFGRP